MNMRTALLEIFDRNGFIHLFIIAIVVTCFMIYGLWCALLYPAILRRGSQKSGNNLLGQKMPLPDGYYLYFDLCTFSGEKSVWKSLLALPFNIQ
jgi:hypothetical protein